MKYRELAGTGVEVSVVGLGCWQFAGGDMWGDQEDSESIDTVHAALDVGINLFDTAESYGSGKSEEVLGAALRDRRTKAIIATKTLGSTYSPAEMRSTCEKSLKRLRTDYIDIYQLHWPRQGQVEAESIFEGVEKLKESGKIRYFGVCNFGINDLRNLLPAGSILSNQLGYSMLWRAIEYEVVPECMEKGISILAYSSLVHGLLSGRYESMSEFPDNRARTLHFAAARQNTRHGQPGQEELTEKTLISIRQICAQAGITMANAAYGWVMGRPGIASVLAGARNPDQVRQNAAIAETDFSDTFLAKLTEATEDLKRAFGAHIDMWTFPGRSS